MVNGDVRLRWKDGRVICEREMLNLVKNLLEITPTISGGQRRPFVMEIVKADDAAKLGKGPSKPAPKFIGNIIAFILDLVGPKGLEFAHYSLPYYQKLLIRQSHMG
nr:7-hydroxymethyl chlorophyll a reductase, chloroplastic [Tanacetum cinerariifolium]